MIQPKKSHKFKRHEKKASPEIQELESQKVKAEIAKITAETDEYSKSIFLTYKFYATLSPVLVGLIGLIIAIKSDYFEYNLKRLRAEEIIVQDSIAKYTTRLEVLTSERDSIVIAYKTEKDHYRDSIGKIHEKALNTKEQENRETKFRERLKNASAEQKINELQGQVDKLFIEVKESSVVIQTLNEEKLELEQRNSELTPGLVAYKLKLTEVYTASDGYNGAGIWDFDISIDGDTQSFDGKSYDHDKKWNFKVKKDVLFDVSKLENQSFVIRILGKARGHTYKAEGVYTFNVLRDAPNNAGKLFVSVFNKKNINLGAFLFLFEIKKVTA